MSVLLKATELLADPANEGVNHLVDVVGKGSILTAAGINGAEYVGVIEQGLGITQYAAMVAMIGGVFYIVKLGLDIAINIRKLKED